jgi:hypothetical protein
LLLQLSADQQKEIDQFETDASGRLEKSLSDAQRVRLKDLLKNPGGFAPGGPPIPPDIEHVLAKPIREKLTLTAEQDKLLDVIQKQATEKLEKILNQQQRGQLKGLRDITRAFAGGVPPGGGPGAPRGGPGFGGFGAPGGGPRGFMGFGGGGEFNGGSSIFRAYRYGTDYVGLVGKTLKPGKTIEELEAGPPVAQK